MSAPKLCSVRSDRAARVTISFSGRPVGHCLASTARREANWPCTAPAFTVCGCTLPATYLHTALAVPRVGPALLMHNTVKKMENRCKVAASKKLHITIGAMQCAMPFSCSSQKLADEICSAPTDEEATRLHGIYDTLLAPSEQRGALLLQLAPVMFPVLANN